ncbi:MAG: nuA3 HAT complex component nto1 [Phylliscum demangeonii]|nr:MAG: nuA3 HAT complex component nto1 [Phylliscum demangeonii]
MPPSTLTTTTPSTSRHRAPRSAAHADLVARSATDPVPMRRKYVPGGPGGGGRYIEVDGSETPVGGTGPGGYAYTGPRGRVGRENAANGVSPPPMKSPKPFKTAKPFKTVKPLKAPKPPTSLRKRESAMSVPRYSSAAAAAAAVVQGDGYKPREERGWEELHPHLDIDAPIAALAAPEVDGTVTNTTTTLLQASRILVVQPGLASVNGVTDGAPQHSPSSASHVDGVPAADAAVTSEANGALDSGSPFSSLPKKRKVGRPFKHPGAAAAAAARAALNDSAGPATPKIVPPPGPNPREKLNLPKPSFRLAYPFQQFEQKGAGQVRYVDRSMANVGYQETDFFLRPESTFIRLAEGTIEEDLDLVPGLKADSDVNTALGGGGVGRVEYDMDEQDDEWLVAHNDGRRGLGVEGITREVFEITMTKIEKEWYALEKRIPKPNPKPPQTQRPRSGSAAAVNGELPGAAGEEQDSKCAICDDGDCENTNAIVFCDGCDLAVHQDCYGVPFIPEGQWLCRKCQLIGRATPTCIFCPNTDGAFKQTNSSRWSHLLCAIWIPEVSLGNPTFMEPVMDVEKVPKQRWKLTCYICRQKMGACVQCGNKNCFVAFHVTCARRAKLFLKMKSAHGGPGHADASVLKAYCDKHVPADWRRENDVDAAIVDAQEYYHHTMRGRIWADSQQSALAATPSQHTDVPGQTDDSPLAPMPRLHLTLGGNKRKANQKAKIIWKLPSGAPVIPQVVYNAVESSLARFNIRKRKEYVADACRYWTLKREARRGAALLKRLQLQMETFSSMEVTRRNYGGMGAAGQVRLQRRIEFATNLLRDLERLRLLCDEVKKRERDKLKEAEMLKDIVDTVYCPISALLWPILERAQSLDGKGVFRAGFAELRTKLEARFHSSVAQFSADFRAIFTAALGSETAADELMTNGQLEAATATATMAATPEQKALRALAKRIIKGVQGLFEDAVRNEADLGGKPYEKELLALEALLHNDLSSRRASIVGSTAGERAAEMNGVHGRPHSAAPGMPGTPAALTTVDATAIADVEMEDVGPVARTAHDSEGAAAVSTPLEPPLAHADSDATTLRHASGPPMAAPFVPPSPPPLDSPADDDDLLAPLSRGGISWYMDAFDPVGTTIHEERWTGRDVVRGMSEELSEIDDDELQGLAAEEVHAAAAAAAAAAAKSDQTTSSPSHSPLAKTPAARPKKPRRRNRHW